MNHLLNICNINGAEVEPVEVWKPIPGFIGLYEASSLGRVKSLGKYIGGKHNADGTQKRAWRKERIMRVHSDKDGYQNLTLTRDGRCYYSRTHRLVAMAFIPNPDNKPIVHHKDEDVTNNKPNNLEWVTGKENLDASNVFDKLAKIHGKQIAAFDLQGNLIAIYPSAQEASRKLRIDVRNISARARGVGNQTHGYKFSYIESEVMPSAALR